MRTEELFYSKGYEHIIIAPHCDDELIGCSEIMVNAEKVTVMIQPSEASDFKTRFLESKAVVDMIVSSQGARMRKTIECHPVCNLRWGHTVGSEKHVDKLVFWFPDPTFEHHPEHKMFTPDLQKLIVHNAKGHDVIFGLYSTNMLVPYLHKLPKEATASKMILADKYETQEGYFKQHNDSFFFEGRVLL